VENLAAERAKQYLTIIECDIFDPAAIAKGIVQITLKTSLTLAGKVTNLLSNSVSQKMAERSEAKSAEQSFASKNFKF